MIDMFEVMNNFRSDDPRKALPLKRSYYNVFLSELEQAKNRVDELRKKDKENPSQELQENITQMTEYMNGLKKNIETLGNEIKELESQTS